MSIPRLAIQRPVTMFMISAVITLLGLISLTRLPVDLMPEFEQPTLNVRTSYPGVGPLEIEELITRPLEQAVSAVPGIVRVQSSSSACFKSTGARSGVRRRSDARVAMAVRMSSEERKRPARSRCAPLMLH